MKYNELQITASKKAKRLGRGIAAGQGKTAGRGTKGQKSRTGSSKKPGFAGGQNPLMQKLPKLPGFRSLRTPAEIVTTGQIAKLGLKVVGADELAKAHLISSPFVAVKVLNKGELTKPVTVKLPLATKTAVVAIEQAGGAFEKSAILSRPASKKSEDKK